jgi:hypothetical protein
MEGASHDAPHAAAANIGVLSASIGSAPGPAIDRLVDARQMATIMGRSVNFIYAHKAGAWDYGRGGIIRSWVSDEGAR